MRQDKAGEIACRACDETDRVDHPDRLTGPSKCGVNDPFCTDFPLRFDLLPATVRPCHKSHPYPDCSTRRRSAATAHGPPRAFPGLTS
uniref:Uncharacterized protein n=1 Tax=uncultured alpha proteobacterium HF0070_17D04 TaxID=710805 RepID=E0XS83_9PROT|nr:hypothetical protein [uncultured alpha proteobacterium HF0070_17D04]